MDLLTQGVLGAAAAQAVLARKLPRSAWLIGAVGGLLADADVLIPGGTDPLGGLTWHRHFSHSLIFIPIGAFIAALPFFFMPALRQKRWLVYLSALIGYATHGVLDACTSYGTLLFWPFSDQRVSWDFIAIIDPAFTVPLILGIVLTAWLKQLAAVRVSLALALAYMMFGWVQRDRALEIQRELAAVRGHAMARGRVIPSPLSLMLWRSVYVDTQGQIHADAVRVPYLSDATVMPGATAKVFTLADAKQHLKEPRLLRAFEEYEWFADGFLALNAEEPWIVGDMRYCVEPESMESLWGFFLDDPAAFAVRSEGRQDLQPGNASLMTGRRLVRFAMSRGQRLARVWLSLTGDNPAFQTMATIKLRFDR